MPKWDVITTKNAPEVIIALYGYIEAEHKCMDVHRDNGDIR